MLVVQPVIQLCSLLKAFSTLRSVEESLDISLDNHKHSFLTEGAQLMNDTLMHGVSLTYGSPRQHIWTFANALDEVRGGSVTGCTCIDSSRPNPPPSFVGNDYFCETGVPPGQHWSYIASMLMIPCGMVKVVVQLAHAAHSIIHHGFVNNYLSQLMLIWKSDSAHMIKQVMKILR